jgi:hypothetical protein
MSTIKPSAWICQPKVQRHPERHLIRGVSALEPTAEEREFAEVDGDEFVPLYDQAALDAAVAAERDKWRILTDESAHIFNGGCPYHNKWNVRDPACPACVALGDWVAP